MEAHLTRLRVTPAAAANELTEALRRGGCVAARFGVDEVAAVVPIDGADAASRDEAADTVYAELQFFLRAWQARRKELSVEIVHERFVTLTGRPLRRLGRVA